MTAGLYFLKLELNYLHDDAFNTELTDAQKWRYVQLYMLAKDLNAGGSFVSHGKQLSIKGIAYHLHMETMVDQLQADMDAIAGIGLLCENGHGPCLARFVKEQETPHTDAERKADQRLRELNQSQGSHEPVTVQVTTRVTESESDIESDIESESEESQSVPQSPQQATDDQSLTDQVLTASKRKGEICNIAGIPPKYSGWIISDHNTTPEDILAELAYNYSKKGKVKKPGIITGMNLTAHPQEKAAEEWYDQVKQLQVLPSSLKQKLGLDFQSDQEGLDTLIDVTTRIEGVEDGDQKAPGYLDWQKALTLLEPEMPRDSFQKYLGATFFKELIDDKFIVVVWGADKTTRKDWLESRVAKIAERILAGIVNKIVSIQFVVEEGGS